MINKNSIGFRITISFLCIVAIMAGLGIFAVIQMKNVQSSFEEMAASGIGGISRLGAIRAAAQKQAVLIRDITSYEDLSIQKSAIKEMKEADTTIMAASEALISQSALFDASLQQLIKEVAQKHAAQRPVRLEAISAVQDMNIDLAKDLVYKQLRPLQAELDAILDKAQGEITKAAHVSVEASGKLVTKLIFMLSLCTLLGAAFGVAVALWLTRSIKGPLVQAVKVAQTVAAGDLTSCIEVKSSDETGKLLQALKEMNESLKKIVGEVRAGTDSISTGAQQIASGNADLSQRTEEQAASLEETASAMEELTSTVKQNAENAMQANKLAEQASAVAVKGGSAVSQVVATMSEINESSQKIVDIISVIDGIAFQTNILALNAAVEAARAGEQGRGFAVVASEVRNLSQRSAAAAKEIKVLINDSVGKVDDCSKLVDQAGKTMEEVVSSVQRVTAMMVDIASASKEQSTGITQVSQTVAQMDEVTQQNAALVEEAAAASQSMQEEAQNLARLMAVFKLAGTAGSAAPTERTRNEPSRKEGVAPMLPKQERKPAKSTAVSTRVTPPLKSLASKKTGSSGTDEWEEF